jgi:hypothetical protein
MRKFFRFTSSTRRAVDLDTIDREVPHIDKDTAHKKDDPNLSNLLARSFTVSGGKGLIRRCASLATRNIAEGRVVGSYSPNRVLPGRK